MTALRTLRRHHRQHVTERALARAVAHATTPSERQELLVLEARSHR